LIGQVPLIPRAPDWYFSRLKLRAVVPAPACSSNFRESSDRTSDVRADAHLEVQVPLVSLAVVHFRSGLTAGRPDLLMGTGPTTLLTYTLVALAFAAGFGCAGRKAARYLDDFRRIGHAEGH
jgi:hypothetical protein